MLFINSFKQDLRSLSSSVKLKFVVPSELAVWTITSTLIPIELKGSKIEDAMPGLSFMLLRVILLTPLEVGIPVTAFLIYIFFSPSFLKIVPFVFLSECFIVIGTSFIAAISIDLGCIFAPREAISSISS